jgi:signal transduction histidine kinase
VQNVAWLAELYRLSSVAASMREDQEGLAAMLRHIVAGCGAVSGSLALVPPDRSTELELVAGIDLPPHVIGSRMPFGAGIAGRVAAAGNALLLQGESGKTLGSERLQARGSSMCWPLRVKERTVGTLSVNRAFEQPAYTPDDLEHGTIMANVVALVVDNWSMRRAEQARIAALSRMNAEVTAAHQQLKDAQMQLLQSEKLASIGQLAAGVAHEINNPVGYVYSNIGSLQRYVNELLEVIGAYEAALPVVPPPLAAVLARADLPFLREDVVTLIAESREGLERVRKIVQDLKDFSRVDAGDEWQVADINDGLRSTLNIVHNELKYRAAVSTALGALPRIECLPSQLNQVFMNLLVNAGQAMPEKNADGSPHQGRIHVTSGAEPQSVWVAITDNGCGIPPAHLARIFEPFFTTKPVGKGTGLGLSVSYSIVKKHGGRIEVDSRPGETTFRVILPLKAMKDDAAGRR